MENNEDEIFEDEYIDEEESIYNDEEIDDQNSQNNNIADELLRQEKERLIREKYKQYRNNKLENDLSSKNKYNNPNIMSGGSEVAEASSGEATAVTGESAATAEAGTAVAAGETTVVAGEAAAGAGTAAAAGGTAASGGLAALMSNPYFWIAVAVIAIIVLLVIVVVIVFVIIAGNEANDYNSGQNGNGACTISVGGNDYSNIKVRLLDCKSGKPIEGEELVDFDKYVLGVAYAETEGFEAEALKVEALAAKSYALRRADKMGGAFGLKLENANGQSILSIRNCTSDQVYCDPDVGCWAEGNNTGNTVHSGKKGDKKQYKSGLSQDSEMRQAVSEVHNKVLTQSDENIYYATYRDTNQNAWNNMAKSGSSYEQIVAKHYPDATISTLSCQSIENGSCVTSTPIKISGNNFHVSSPFGPRPAPTPGASTFHQGIDLAFPVGTPIYSIFDGKVTTSTDDYGSGGKAVIIDHDLDGDGKTDYQSQYYHMSKRDVNVGDIVSGGQKIGEVGSTGASTGPHLHFGLKGESYIDPKPVLVELLENKSIFDRAKVCTSVSSEGGAGSATLGSHYYNQWDYRHVPYCSGYSDGATVQTSGCFVGSLSIAIANLYNRDSSVTDMANYICSKKRAFRPMGSGTNSNLLYEKDLQELFKFNVQTLEAKDRTVDNIISYLSKGYRIMVSVINGHFNPRGTGHYIELDATNGSEIYVYDTGKWQRNGWYSKSEIQSEIINHVNTGMWVIKKR